jgi:ABC-type polysaccharide/polyol phosphate transport system ATPase subunit
LARVLDIVLRRPLPRRVAVESVTLSVAPGERLGIIGENGSGKSTLLKLIAGILRPTSGSVVVRGVATYLTGFNHGLQRRLTVTENIRFAGGLMGLSKNQIEQAVPKVIESAELLDRFDQKVATLSDGMMARLAFYMAMHLIETSVPDIIILDEVFSGAGDDRFQAKSLARMEELVRSGASVLLANHNLALILKQCDRVIWMEKGAIRMEGDPQTVTEAYRQRAKTV